MRSTQLFKFVGVCLTATRANIVVVAKLLLVMVVGGAILSGCTNTFVAPWDYSLDPKSGKGLIAFSMSTNMYQAKAVYDYPAFFRFIDDMRKSGHSTSDIEMYLEENSFRPNLLGYEYQINFLLPLRKVDDPEVSGISGFLDILDSNSKSPKHTKGIEMDRRLVVLELDGGVYEYFQLLIFDFGHHTMAKEDFSIPFEVIPGKVNYIGSFSVIFRAIPVEEVIHETREREFSNLKITEHWTKKFTDMKLYEFSIFNSAIPEKDKNEDVALLLHRYTNLDNNDIVNRYLPHLQIKREMRFMKNADRYRLFLK